MREWSSNISVHYGMEKYGKGEGEMPKTQVHLFFYCGQMDDGWTYCLS